MRTATTTREEATERLFFVAGAYLAADRLALEEQTQDLVMRSISLRAQLWEAIEIASEFYDLSKFPSDALNPVLCLECGKDRMEHEWVCP